MRTFSITAGANTLEIDVLRHVRVDGSRFPTPSSDSIADYFLIDARLNGALVDFYPGEGRPHDPLAFGFVGKKIVPVYALVAGNPDDGTAVYAPTGVIKRGGDFRSRFFRLIARRLGKAIRARQLNKRIGQVAAADEASATGLLGRLLRGNFTDPQDLKAFSIDDACRFLRDAQGGLETGDKPPGTVSAIDCDFDSHATSGGVENETGTLLSAGNNGTVLFTMQLRFSLSSITAGSTINDSDFQINENNTGGADAGDQINLNQYGTSNPDTDNAATKYTNSGGTTYASLVVDATGSITADLGATADTDIGNQISSPGWFTVGTAVGTGIAANDNPNFQAIENAGTDPATLTVDYTAPAATGAAWIGGKGKWW